MTELRRAMPFLAFSLLLLVAGCALLPAATPAARDRLAEELRAAERRWAAADLSSYTFTIRYSCFCPWTDPMTVTVVDDQVTSVTMNGEVVADAGRMGVPLLIESAFEDVRANLDAHEVDAQFDPELGFPARVVADPIENAVDEEFSFEITGFVAGNGPAAGVDPMAAELVAHRRQWLAQGVASYAWKLSFSCECSLGGAATITVLDGVVTGVRLNQDAVPPDVAGFPLTVDGLYAEALRTLEAGGAVTVRWDAASGMPRTMLLDHEPAAIDDELSVTVDSFVPAP